MNTMYQKGGRIINPATGDPFVQADPTPEVVKLRREIIRQLRSRYDAAQTTHQNENHWRWADSLSPNAANSLSVRKKLRERSRYEVHNNGYLKGIALTLTEDFVGSGPTLQITDDRFSKQQQELIERRFKTYAKKIKLRRMLWQCRFAKLEDGEAFEFAIRNPSLRHPIKRDYRIFECDQVSSTPAQKSKRIYEIDGIRFDRVSGDPTEYFLLNDHPGETELFSVRPSDGEWIPRDQVIHWFRQDRRWHRGIPETTPTLPLWALLRRYTLAVVQNAEIAADFTVLLKSAQGPNNIPFPTTGTPGQPSESDPQGWFDSFPIDRGLMTVLPDLYDLTQLKPTQPVSMYDAFVAALIQEAARPLLVPRNVALGNSGGYNMASGAADWQCYRKSIAGERIDCESEVLEHVVSEWWYEAIRMPEYFSDDLLASSSIWDVGQRFIDLRDDPPDYCFLWDEMPEHTDPVKVATAIDILHKGHHISDKDVQERRFNRSTEQHYRNLKDQADQRRRLFPEEVQKPETKPSGKPTTGKKKKKPQNS